MTRDELAALPLTNQKVVVVLAANHLGLFRELAGADVTPGALAARLGLDERGVTALCDALVSLGVLRRDGEALVLDEGLKPALDPGARESQAAILEHHWHIMQRWARLDEVVRTGEPLPRPPQDPGQLRAFILGMADLARREAATLWDAVNLAGRRHLVDVGGGPGELALAALDRWPGLDASVLDRPDVLEIAREYAAPRAVSSRLRFVPGDAVTDDIPACDAALVSALIHSYGPDDVRRIGRHVAAGLEGGGIVVIREFMWDDATHSGPAMAGLFAVNMLVGTRGGRCYAPEEIRELFGPSFTGWRASRVDERTALLVGFRS